MRKLRAVVFATTAAALRPARTPLRRGTAAYTASLPSTAGEIYADAPSGLFGARSSIEPYLALEIPVVDETATKEEEEGSSFGLDLEMRRPGGFAACIWPAPPRVCYIL